MRVGAHAPAVWRPGAPRQRHLVLVGGGHTHVQVLRDFMMHGLPPRTEVTVVLDRAVAIYSGMVPGLLAGQYEAHELEIDVVPLARRASCAVVLAACRGVEAGARRILLADGRADLAYDVASFDIGSTVAHRDLPGVKQHAIATRPISELVRRTDQVIRRCHTIAVQRPPQIVVVGAGAGGVEVAFTLQARLARDLPQPPEVRLVYAAPRPMDQAAPRLSRRIEQRAGERGIQLLSQRRVHEVGESFVLLDDGTRLPADATFWVTGAAPHNVLRNPDIEEDERGFALVRDTLQLVSQDDVFAVGDCASLDSGATPKAGVYAVRQGPVLIHNLRSWLAGDTLQEYRAQRDFLTLLNLGQGTAMATKFGWVAEGRSMFRLKDWIDRRFMERFQVLDPDGNQRPEFEMEESDEPMACGGCAAKVEQDALGQALDRLHHALGPGGTGSTHGDGHEETGELRGNLLLDGRDDVATFAIDEERHLVLNLDGFRGFTNDPWLVGRCAANNALSDLYAKAVRPQCVQAWVTVPLDLAPEQASEQLFQVLHGARSVFDRAGVELVGGHTTTGPELQVGFAVDGLVLASAEGPRALLPASAPLHAGDEIIVTGTLGTGVVLHADMMGRARGVWLERVLASMQRSNRRAGELAREHGVRACTDITGFGLAGHLLTLLPAHREDSAAESAGPSARLHIDVERLPALPGALELLHLGLRSTAHALNRGRMAHIDAAPSAQAHAKFELLFDPQTCGGLLMVVPPARRADLLEALARAETPGQSIGSVRSSSGDAASRLRVTVGCVTDPAEDAPT